MEKNHCSSCHDGHGEPFFITTAIAYASRMPHIGNVYEAIFTDAIARYKRSRGYDVFFLTGTDEHGQKIEDIARAEGVSPKEYVDRVAADIRGLWDRMNVSYDHFIRTTDAHHEAAVQKIFRRLYEQGDIYKDSYEGWYCVPCESFFTETQVTDGKCPDCGAPVQRAKEEAYFFRMSKYADRLLEYIESHPGFIEPVSRQKEMINNFIKPGLQDLCVSRSSFKWGIPVDFDEGHVIYVWLDALTNYITALGYTGDGNNGSNYAKYWPADIHVIGKDIMRFHSIYWPIFLMALGEPLPKKVFGHPWLLFGEDKMSKSKGDFLTVSLLESKGYDPLAYRMFCLQSHYRKPLVFSYDNLDNVESAYEKLVKKIATFKDEGEMEQEAFEAFRKKFADAIRDDLNTSMALTIVYDVVKADISEKTKLALLNDFDQVLALNLTTAGKERLDAGTSVDAELEQFINEKIAERAGAKKAKDFARADAIRDELLARGITIKDTREGVVWERNA